MTAKFTVMEYVLNILLNSYVFSVRKCLDPDYDTDFPLK